MVEKKIFCFFIKKRVSIDVAWAELECAEIEPLYSIEDDYNKEIYGYLSDDQQVKAQALLTIDRTALSAYQAVDWEAQWATHGHDFYDGYVHIRVAGKIIKLEPGPGFGDLSHPTTNLVLDLMENSVQGKHVLDIGCGSGVLSLAALALGANAVYGIDIDQEALNHAKRNAQVNHYGHLVHFCLPYELTQIHEGLPLVAVMNMILSEQKVALNSIKQLSPMVSRWMISGLLKEERQEYLNLAASWNWVLEFEKTQDCWLGLSFSHKGN